MSSTRIAAQWMLLAVIALAGCQTVLGIDQRNYVPDDAGADPDGAVADAVSVTVTPACTEYCNNVFNNCTGTNALYATLNACLAVCAILPPGDPNEPGEDNTVVCRNTEALRAGLGEPEVHCPRAGPGGNGSCGTNCESYCLLFKKACPTAMTPITDCPKACSVLLDTQAFDVVKNHDGDSVQCRLVHVSNASWLPVEHCPHARIAPVTPPCNNDPEAAPSCDDYCRTVMGSCTGAQAVYESVQQCEKACAALAPGKEKDTTEDTVGCRKYHSYNALGDPLTHCPHAGPGGDGHCGMDNCTGYCSILAASCPAAYVAQFGSDLNACLTRCRSVPGAAANSGFSIMAANGNSLQCRMLHALRAFTDEGACAAAMGSGDCQ